MSDHPVAPGFELPNVGPGSDPCSLSGLAREHDFVVLYFQLDHDCTNCRKQVKQVAQRYESFRARDAVVVSVLPEDRERAREWQERFDLPYPLLADPGSTVADEYGQPVRLGFLGDVSDFLGRMPRVVVVDARSGDPRIVWTHSGRSTFDRPATTDVLDAIDEHRD
ncbi:MAG: peroxiredoxin family protein [Haloarculaceae archaeon]